MQQSESNDRRGPQQLQHALGPPTFFGAGRMGSSSIRSDGANAATTMTDDTDRIQASLPELQMALANIPDAQKTAYLAAVDAVPHLVERESEAAAFLRCEHYQAAPAARRLCAYWETRQKIFGSDRILLPMTQTGEGALKRADITLLHTGYMAFLPNDFEGRTVFFYDPSRLNKCSRESRLRCMFYLYSVAAESRKSQVDGIALLAILDKKVDIEQLLNDDLMAFVFDVLPIKLSQLHLICYPPDWPTVSHFEGNAPSLLNKTTVSRFADRTMFHIEHSFANLLTKLTACGFTSNGLPEKLGGAGEYSRHSQWCEQRTRSEWGLPAGRGMSNATVAAAMPSVATQKAAPPPMPPASSSHSLADLKEIDKTDRKRKMNVLHSRRKRERKKIEVSSLQDTCSQLQSNNLDLYQKNKALDGLVEQATTLVHNYERTGQLPTFGDIPNISGGMAAPQPFASMPSSNNFGGMNAALPMQVNSMPFASLQQPRQDCQQQQLPANFASNILQLLMAQHQQPQQQQHQQYQAPPPPPPLQQYQQPPAPASATTSNPTYDVLMQLLSAMSQQQQGGGQQNSTANNSNFAPAAVSGESSSHPNNFGNSNANAYGNNAYPMTSASTQQQQPPPQYPMQPQQQQQQPIPQQYQQRPQPTNMAHTSGNQQQQQQGNTTNGAASSGSLDIGNLDSSWLAALASTLQNQQQGSSGNQNNSSGGGGGGGSNQWQG